MFSVTDRRALSFFLRTSLWHLPTSSFTATSVDQPPTSLRVRPHRCCTVKSRTQGTSASAPIWGRVFHRLFRCFLLTIAHPGAAYLPRYNLLLLVVYYPHINSVGPKILVLSLDWEVPVYRCMRSLIYQLWLSWWIPPWRHFKKSQVFYDVKNRTFRTASCLARYFVWANAGQAESTWAMLSGAVPHSLQVGSLAGVAWVLWMAYSLVGNSCS